MGIISIVFGYPIYSNLTIILSCSISSISRSCDLIDPYFSKVNILSN